MAWSYELRGSDNRLVEVCRGFATKKQAQTAAQGAKSLMQSFDLPPNNEHLTITTKDEAASRYHNA